MALRREQTQLLKLNPFSEEFFTINPDYVGWLKIDGTNIDFPIVRGDDNIKYLTTTFKGDENVLDAVFMDYRNTGDDVPHIIIYGHQARDEQDNRLLFGSLHEFLNEQYLSEHPNIIFMENDSMYKYEIFRQDERTYMTRPIILISVPRILGVSSSNGTAHRPARNKL
jgi:sortase B